MVMIAMVITRFVAILEGKEQVRQSGALARQRTIRRRERRRERGRWEGGALPTGHTPQRLDTPVDIALTLEQSVVGVLDGLALDMEVG